MLSNEVREVRTTINGYNVVYWITPRQATTLQIYKDNYKVYGALVQPGTALETAVRKVIELSKGGK